MTVLISTSPQRPSDVIAEVAAIDPGLVPGLVAAARLAQRDWWRASAATRSAALAAIAGELRSRSAEAVALVVREVGKPIGEATGEVARSIALLDYYAQAAYAPMGQAFTPSQTTGLLFTDRVPHGVAGLITPWNFPLAIPLWKIAPALAVGNAVVLKPSPEAVGCAALLAEILNAHLPTGLFTVIAGGGATGSALVDSVDAVSFTGSAAVGSQVAAQAARRGIPVQCEMGGQNAAIVLPDAEPLRTAATIAGAAMGYSGQKCTATRRIVLVGEQPLFIEALVMAVSAFVPQDPATAGAVVGPVITAESRDRLVHAADAAVYSGGRMLTGGGAVDGEGWFVRPGVADGIPHGHALLTDETFGPLVILQHARDVSDAVVLAEASPYGLVTSVHGRDLDGLLQVAREVRSGMVKINAPTTGVEFYTPFGGMQASSIGGREQGLAALEFYSRIRTITVAPHAP